MSKLKKIFWQLMKVDQIRYWVCIVRYRLLKSQLLIYQKQNRNQISSDVVDYNLTAFNNLAAAFGCGGRMSLLIHPLVALLYDRPDAKILIVGPRTEDDIFWMRSYGFKNTIGLDLFSYSKTIQVGDLHDAPFENESFDAVLLGWVLAYSKEPSLMIRESKRILKNQGFLGIGMERVASQNFDVSSRENSLNSIQDLLDLVSAPLKFEFNPKGNGNHHIASIFEISKDA